jgi:hypothetical protein
MDNAKDNEYQCQMCEVIFKKDRLTKNNYLPSTGNKIIICDGCHDMISGGL